MTLSGKLASQEDGGPESQRTILRMYRIQASFSSVAEWNRRLGGHRWPQTSGHQKWPKAAGETSLFSVGHSGCCGPSHDIPVNLLLNIILYIPYLLGERVSSRELFQEFLGSRLDSFNDSISICRTKEKLLDVLGTGQASAGRAAYFILLHRRGALEPPIYSQLARSTGESLGWPLACEVGSGD